MRWLAKTLAIAIGLTTHKFVQPFYFSTLSENVSYQRIEPEAFPSVSIEK